MDQGHFQHPVQIHMGQGAVFIKHHGHQGKVPGMFGVGLPAGTISQKGLAQYIFHLVHLGEKGQLLGKALAFQKIISIFEYFVHYTPWGEESQCGERPVERA